MDLGLNDKVIVVTGGGGRPGSIGRAIVSAIFRENGIPVIWDVSTAHRQDIQEAAARARKPVLFCPCDLTAEHEVRAAAENVLSKFGRIDGLVNNLGVNDGIGLDSTLEAFIQSIRLNLGSAFLATKFCKDALVVAKGSIVNIGSKVAVTGQGGTSAYAAAKGGLMSLTREWAVDLSRHRVRANTIIIAESWTPAYDDWISTRSDRDDVLRKIEARIPLERRMTRPDEIADLAVFLLSSRSSHITAQHIHSDGGYTHLDRAMDDLNR